MAQYRVKAQSFINDTIVEEGTTIEYNPPEGTTISSNLEAVEDSVDEADVTYHAFSRDQLKDELNKRGITFAANATDKKLRELLEADDSK